MADEYGRLPAWVVDSGTLARMKPAEARVYLALCSRIRRRGDWQCWPSRAWLAETAGLSGRSVVSATEGLERIGAISVTRGGGRKHTNRYYIRPGNSEAGFTVSRAKRGKSGAGKGEASFTRNERTGMRQQNTGAVGERDEKPTDPRTDAAAEMERQGIWQRAVRELIGEMPGLTARIVRQLATDRRLARAESRGALLASIIRAEAPRLIDLQRRAHRSERIRRERAQADREREAEAQEQSRSDQAADLARVVAMDAAERHRLRAAACHRYPFRRMSWAAADPCGCWSLARAMIEITDEEGRGAAIHRTAGGPTG